MAAATQLAPDRVASPLASNNPFRNRLASQPSPRPTPTNPFLDATEQSSPPRPMEITNGASKGGVVDTAANLLGDLDLNAKSRMGSNSRPVPNGDTKRENVPPHHARRPPGHRPAPSDEEKKRRDAKLRAQKGEMDIFADPADVKRVRDKSHRRRNSESSVRDKSSLDPEEEKKRRERKYREKSRTKQQKRLDVIDKLDVTSIYGTGLFHHDGPFDACNPHRNRKGSRQAPMHAFPADSMNMRLGGSGPLKSKMDVDQYHGRHAEGYNDYNEAAIVDGDAEYIRRGLPERTASFNPTSREIVHGSESAGLGTSTFLDGAPASRKAIEENEKQTAEQQQQMQLSRKKSLAQRFVRRDRSNTLENKISSRRIQSPEGALTPTTPLETAKTESGGNPFFENYDQEYEKKGAQIAFAEAETKGRARAPSSPRREMPAPLERSRTADSAGFPDEPKSAIEAKSGGGFLNRMKSLKAPRKPRPERRETSS